MTSYRVTKSVNITDQDVLDWFKTQNNYSASIRRLIKDTIARSGNTDYIDYLAKKANGIKDEERNPLTAEDVAHAHKAVNVRNKVNALGLIKEDD